jgi:purine-binding chemotaxis protein CheW
MLDSNDALYERTDVSQYLTFILGGEEYGIDILKVQEIRGYEKATEIPNSPDFILGIMNLRGSVVPIVDLRKRFNMKGVEYNNLTVTVLVKVASKGKERTVGMVVDSVSEVYTITKDDIEDTPDIGGSIEIGFIKGLASINEKMVILLDIDLLINSGVLEDVVD